MKESLMNKYWTLSQKKEQTFLECVATHQLLTEYKLFEMKFLELIGSGAGDQYIFQGTFDLGSGFHMYNLAVYSLGPTVAINHLAGGAMYGVSDSEFEKGVIVAKKLVETLPDELSEKMRHSVEWLKTTWNSPIERYPYH